jgi:hypothetical protein
MKIQYTVEQDDLRVFVLYVMRNNPEFKRQRRIAGVVIAAVFLLIATHLAYRDHSAIPYLWFGITGSAFQLYFFRRSPSVSRKQIERLYPQQDNRGVLCEHTVELTEAGVVETTNTGEQKTVFAGILRIVDSDNHAFIFIGSQMAYVIPKSKVTSGDFNSFMTRLKEKWESQHKDAPYRVPRDNASHEA